MVVRIVVIEGTAEEAPDHTAVDAGLDTRAGVDVRGDKVVVGVARLRPVDVDVTDRRGYVDGRFSRVDLESCRAERTWSETTTSGRRVRRRDFLRVRYVNCEIAGRQSFVRQQRIDILRICQTVVLVLEVRAINEIVEECLLVGIELRIKVRLSEDEIFLQCLIAALELAVQNRSRAAKSGRAKGCFIRQ